MQSYLGRNLYLGEDLWEVHLILLVENKYMNAGAKRDDKVWSYIYCTCMHIARNMGLDVRRVHMQQIFSLCHLSKRKAQRPKSNGVNSTATGREK